MGAGKTTVGRALGQRLNWLFEDLDDRIVAREGRTVAEIFRDSGERVFRAAEQAAMRELLEELGSGVARVIALGGGAFAQREAAALLQAADFPVVFLDAPVEVLWQRCCQQAEQTGAQRPLLRSMKQFRELYESRRKAYSQAVMKIPTEARSVESIADEIAESLRLQAIAIRPEQGEME
jgi:shikimate kinase